MKNIFFLNFILLFVSNSLLAKGFDKFEFCNNMAENYENYLVKPIEENRSEFFVVDINNDGKEEIVFEETGGSGRYTDLLAIQLRKKQKIMRDCEDINYEYGRYSLINDRYNEDEYLQYDDDIKYIGCASKEDKWISNNYMGFGGSYFRLKPLRYNNVTYVYSEEIKEELRWIFRVTKNYGVVKLCSFIPIYINTINFEESNDTELCNKVLENDIEYLPNYKSKYIITDEDNERKKDRYFDDIYAYYPNVDFYNNGDLIDFVEYAHYPGYPTSCASSHWKMEFEFEEDKDKRKTERFFSNETRYCRTSIRLFKYKGNIYGTVKSWPVMGNYRLAMVFMWKGKENKPRRICTFDSKLKLLALPEQEDDKRYFPVEVDQKLN